jgi:hypothetical protein
MIEGLQRLMRNNWQFTIPSDMPDLATILELTVNSARIYIEQTFEADPEGIVIKDDAFQSYKEFCRAKNVTPNANFADEMKSVFYGLLSSGRKWVIKNGKREQPRVWKGINFISETPPIVQETLFTTPKTGANNVPDVPVVPAKTELFQNSPEVNSPYSTKPQTKTCGACANHNTDSCKFDNHKLSPPTPPEGYAESDLRANQCYNFMTPKIPTEVNV